MGDQRFDLVVLEHARLLTDAHHERNIGSVDVGVDEADAKAQLDQRGSQVDRERSLAHSAFARTDGDDVRYSRKGLRPWRRLHVCHIKLL
jgi:hypothetical protein